MKVFLYLTLGYTVIKVDSKCIKELLNFANTTGIHIISLSAKESYVLVKIYTRDEKKFSSVCFEYGIVSRRGIPELIRKYNYRVGVIVGMILFFAVLYISPLFVWEINVSGIDKLSREYVCGLLEEEGVYIGAFSPSVDRRAVYMNILGKTEDISWLSVNFQGSSANVEIVERDYTPVAENLADGANIIAAKDGQITDADIIRGRAVVEKGEIVKKGQLLVSGIFDTVKMGTRYVFSEAEIYAAVNDEYVVEIPLANTKRVYREEKVLERTLKMFGKSINIFKNYSIYDENYDTITRDNNIYIFGFNELPFTIETAVALPYSDEPVFFTESEALAMAKREFYRRIDEEADYTEIIGFEESYTVDNEVLIYRCSVEAVENIAAVSEFSAR